MLARLVAAIEPRHAEAIAATLLDEYRGLPQLWSQTPEALARLIGAWPQVIDLIASARDAALETMRVNLPARRIDPHDARLTHYLTASMGSLPDERLRILFLDAEHVLVADEELQRGGLAHMAIYPRTIFRRALELNAAAIIVVHNHPSGDPAPSDEDVRATDLLERIGRSLEIALLGHIVVTATEARHIDIGGTADGRPAQRSWFPVLRGARDPAERDADERVRRNVETTIRRRLLRRQLLGHPELFGEPAWDMLLDLFAHECEGKRLSMSSLCVAAAIPESSAMRLAQRLVDQCILLRLPDPSDGRRSFMKIAPDVAHRLRAYFAEGAE